MATHHHRLGGRLVEVIAGLGLAVLSAAFLLGCLVFPLWLPPWISESHSVGKLGFAGFMLGLYLLKYPWGALLRYYKYEAHTLRPIRDDETKDRDAG